MIKWFKDMYDTTEVVGIPQSFEPIEPGKAISEHILELKALRLRQLYSGLDLSGPSKVAIDHAALNTNADLVNRAQAFIKTITYKKDAIISSSGYPYGGLHITFSMPTICIYSGNLSPLNSSHTVSPAELRSNEPNLEDFLSSTVRQLIHKTETHEADEWLLIDGVRKFDPHAFPVFTVQVKD